MGGDGALPAAYPHVAAARGRACLLPVQRSGPGPVARRVEPDIREATVRILAAHQPQYLPWLGYFDKMDQADVFVLLDNVQFKKNEWQNRNRIRTADGWQWLTVPVLHRFPQTIAEVEIDNRTAWTRKHRQTLKQNYGRAEHLDMLLPEIEELLEDPGGHLSPLNLALIELMVNALGITTSTVLGSDLVVREDPNLRLIDLCLELDADTYLSGSGAHDYLDEAAFEAAGIEVRLQAFEHPVYEQRYEPFEPFLSTVDLIMNCGRESLSIIRSGRLGTADDHR
jgi:hypothetical protein